ncbi:MAG: YceI family protein [Chromatiales bacterium]|nr:MAG: YceI family protein [Chromatiales bacterium]
MIKTSLAVWLGAVLCATGVVAENWVPVPADSTLKFSAVQQGATFEGVFKAFTAEFDLDPSDPTRARIEATIDMDSVDSLYDERDEYLRGTDWFHVERWPSARFVTERIRAAESGYLADALLTLRDQTQPIALAFTLERLEDGRLSFVGKTVLQRLDFGVGQGEWTNTEWVGNDVTVEVSLVLESTLP